MLAAAVITLAAAPELATAGASPTTWGQWGQRARETLEAKLSTFPSTCNIGLGCVTANDMCKTDADCTTGLTCVIESDYYSQCVDCSPASFNATCNSMSETFLPKAMETCKMPHCADRCPHHDTDPATDTDCVKPTQCAVQADGYYGQCIDCNASVFNTSCVWWSEQIREAAQTLCKESCPTPSSPLA